MKHPFAVLFLALGLVGPIRPAPALAQVAVAPVARGWIGISYEFTTTQTGDQVQNVSRVTDVMEGSPAARAGVRPGDLLVLVNGMDWTRAQGSTIRDLRPGDRLRLVVERDGRRRELEVTAGSRPAEMAEAPTWRAVFSPDSMVERMVKAMDSLRIRISTADGMAFHVTREGRLAADSLMDPPEPPSVMRIFVRGDRGSESITLTPADLPVPEGRASATSPEVRAPFPFPFFRGVLQDSLRTAMDALNQEIRATAGRRAALAREGGATTGSAEARLLDQELERLNTRAGELRSAMERASRDAATARVRAEGEREWAEAVTVRPLAPYVMGQNRVAGAEVVELRPELASYFQVDSGVLVVDVAPGTPAHEAGIQPGDVLIRVAGSATGTVAELRKAMAASRGEAAITLVRRGRTLEVPLGR